MERETRKEREGMEKTRKDGGFGSRSASEMPANWSESLLKFARLLTARGMCSMGKKCGLARKFFAVMIAVACAGMLGGCGESVEFKWVGRDNMSIAGFIDDSLVVAYDCRGWLETTETWNGGYSEEESCGHDRLLVFNYRVQEDGPRWSDSLTNKSGGYRWYQLTDSIFWRWNEKNILLWKIDETAYEMKISRTNEGCSDTFEIDRMHQWLDDGFIALGGRLSAGGDSCQYAVLDTVERTLTYMRMDKDLGWIKECDDVRAWDKDVYCFMPGEQAFEGRLLRNEIDTVDVPVKFTIGDFFGDVLRPNAYLCNLVGDKVNCLDVEWRGGLTFYKNDGIAIALE